MDLAEAPNKLMIQNFLSAVSRERTFPKGRKFCIGGTGCSGRFLSLSKDFSGSQDKLGPNQAAQIQKIN